MRCLPGDGGGRDRSHDHLISGSGSWAATPVSVVRAFPDVLLIDATNVVGSRPNGWWRDRAKATSHLAGEVRIAATQSRLPGPVVIVLEGAARRGVPEGANGGVEIVYAPRQGDDTLVALAAAATEAVVLASADRALGDRCRDTGADHARPGQTVWGGRRRDPSTTATEQAPTSWAPDLHRWGYKRATRTLGSGVTEVRLRLDHQLRGPERSSRAHASGPSS